MGSTRIVLILAILAIGSVRGDDVKDRQKDVENFLKDVNLPDHGGHHEHQSHADQIGIHDHSKHGHENHGDGHGDAHGGHMMKMWFHGGCNEVILFDFWRIDSCLGLVLSFAAIFVMGATYEGIKWFRVFLQVSQASVNYRERTPEHGQAPANGSSCGAAAVPLVEDQRPQQCKNSPFSLSRLVQAGLYVVQLVLAYWLMLIVMTYNTWLTAAVILGAGFGHWVFAVLQFNTPDGEAADSFAADACH